MREETLYAFERRFWEQGMNLVAGVDEAGRGPLAGPVVAGAVILPRGPRIRGLRDSKQVPEEERERLFAEIMGKCQVGVGLVPEGKIDQINIYEAARLAMKMAVERLPQVPQAVLVDGNMHIDCGAPSVDIVRGDRLSASIAAASIVAKVVRDQIMLAYHELEPQFSFHIHKGYATEKHLLKLQELGPSPFHRRSFRPIRQEPQVTLP